MNRSHKAFLPILVLLASMVGAALMIYFKRRTQPVEITFVPQLVRTVEAVAAPHQFVVSSQGTVSARRNIQLVAEVAGRVVDVSPSLAAGGFFNEGDTLITIDPRDYELARVAAAAQVSQAELRLAREKAEAEVALEEWKELGQTRGEPSPLLLRRPQLAEAEAALAAARAQLAKADLDLERTRILAPFPGRVLEKQVDVGQYVLPGSSLGRLYAVDVAEVRLPVSLPDLAYLDLPLDFAESNQRKMPSVRLEASLAGNTNSWSGRIVRVEGEINPRSRMLNLVAEVADPYNRHQSRPNTPPLPVGLFVTAQIVGRTVGEAITLPRTALRGRDQIIVIDSDDRLRFRTVEVLRSDRHRVVIGDGLRDGERVSISLLDTPTEGMPVRVDPDARTRPAPEEPRP